MKFSITLATAALPIALAIPYVPTGGKVIRDESRLETLRNLHKRTLEGIREQNHAVRGLEERGGPVAILGLAGAALVEAGGAGAGIIGGLANRLQGVLTADDQDQVWKNTDLCRVTYETKGGGNCKLDSYDRGASDRTAKHDDDLCSWIDPEENDPPVTFIEGDKGLGTYSIQYTATDEYAWDGIDGTEKCPAEGLCNPQLVFYRDGFNVVLDTWKSQGDVTACQYSGGEDCQGLCNSGVAGGGFSSGGAPMGGDCAVPCEDDTELSDE